MTLVITSTNGATLLLLLLAKFLPRLLIPRLTMTKFKHDSIDHLQFSSNTKMILTFFWQYLKQQQLKGLLLSKMQNTLFIFLILPKFTNKCYIDQSRKYLQMRSKSLFRSIFLDFFSAHGNLNNFLQFQFPQMSTD